MFGWFRFPFPGNARKIDTGRRPSAMAGRYRGPRFRRSGRHVAGGGRLTAYGIIFGLGVLMVAVTALDLPALGSANDPPPGLRRRPRRGLATGPRRSARGRGRERRLGRIDRTGNGRRADGRVLGKPRTRLRTRCRGEARHRAPRRHADEGAAAGRRRAWRGSRLDHGDRNGSRPPPPQDRTEADGVVPSSRVRGRNVGKDRRARIGDGGDRLRAQRDREPDGERVRCPGDRATSRFHPRPRRGPDRRQPVRFRPGARAFPRGSSWISSTCSVGTSTFNARSGVATASISSSRGSGTMTVGR